MNLSFKKESLDISSNNIITGIIALKIENDFYFPEKNWNDSIVILLSSWIHNIDQILNNKNSEKIFNFFDGPFSFLIRKKYDKQEIELFHKSKFLGIYDFNFVEFGKSVVVVCEEIIKARDWANEDIIKLNYSLKKIKPFFS